MVLSMRTMSGDFPDLKRKVCCNAQPHIAFAQRAKPCRLYKAIFIPLLSDRYDKIAKDDVQGIFQHFRTHMYRIYRSKEALARF